VEITADWPGPRHLCKVLKKERRGGIADKRKQGREGQILLQKRIWVRKEEYFKLVSQRPVKDT